MRLYDFENFKNSPLAMGTASQYCLRWNNHQTNLLTAFDSLLRQQAFTDVTLACEDGVNLHAHRLVLAACSSYFANLFATTSPTQHPIVVLKDVKELEMRALLNYMYRGEVNVEHNHLKALLKVAEGLKVKGLVEDLASDAHPLPLTAAHSRPMPPLLSSYNRNGGYLGSRSISPPAVVKDLSVTSAASERWDRNVPCNNNSSRSYCSSPPSPDIKFRPHIRVKEEQVHNVRSMSPPTHPYIHHLTHSQHSYNHQSRIPPLHLDHKMGMRDIYEREETSPRRPIDDFRDRRSSPPENLEPLHISGPESPPSKRSRHLGGDSLISPTPILRTALAHTRSFTPDVTSLVSLANSMMPLPPLLSTRVPSILSAEESRRTHDYQHEAPQNFSLLPTKKNEPLSDEDSRQYPDISRDEDSQEKINNGQLMPDFSSYHLERGNPVHFSNFVSYVPTPKPEWKRYKQYTKADLMEAIAAVKKGMTALQASRKFKVPSRTLYDKIKKMGINTIPRRLPPKRPSNTDIENSESLNLIQEIPNSSPKRDLCGLTKEGGDVSSSSINLLPITLPSLKDEKRERNDEMPEGSNYHEDSPPVETSARGSFALVGRKVYSGSVDPLPLDLTDTEILPNRTQIEERA